MPKATPQNLPYARTDAGKTAISHGPTRSRNDNST